ncbi:MAG: hypothetical protein QM496_21735 [Verrucomicrobiota bacterium]
MLKGINGLLFKALPSPPYTTIRTDRQGLLDYIETKSKESGLHVRHRERSWLMITQDFRGWEVVTSITTDQRYYNCEYEHSIYWKDDETLFDNDFSMQNWLGLHNGQAFWCKDGISTEELGEGVWRTVNYFLMHGESILSGLTPKKGSS